MIASSCMTFLYVKDITNNVNAMYDRSTPPLQVYMQQTLRTRDLFIIWGLPLGVQVEGN